ncbi:MAG: hypothetical protein ABIH66_04985 [bacterium]
MASRVIKRRFKDTPPLDRLDHSYVVPAAAAALMKEEDFSPLETGTLQQAAAHLLPRVGELARRHAIEQAMKRMAVAEEEALEWNANRVLRWFASLIPRKKYPAVILSPPSGPVAALCRLINAPLLPINYRIPVRKGIVVDPEETRAHRDLAEKCANRFLGSNDGVDIVCEHDPIHNRHRTRHTNLLRFRLLDVPKVYTDLMSAILLPGAPIVLIEVRAGWRQYTGSTPRFFFQIGAPGGISDDEYLRGSKRIAEFLEKYMKVEKSHYRMALPHEVLPESGAGMLPAFRDSAYSAATFLQRPILHILCDDLFDLSRLTAALFLRASRKEGKRPENLILHSGNFVHPLPCFTSNTLPLWLPDASFQSRKFAATIMDAYKFKLSNLLLALEPSLADSPDVLPLGKWLELAEGKTKAVYIGASRRAYPRHYSCYGTFWKKFTEWSRQNENRHDMWLTTDEIQTEMERIGIRFVLKRPGEE